MEYYNPNDNNTKRYAAIATLAVLALFVIAACFITFEVVYSPHSRETIVLELEQPQTEVDDAPEEEEQRPIGDATAKDEQTEHKVVESETPQPKESKGEDEVTERVDRQVDKRTLFEADVVSTTTDETVATGSTHTQGESDKDSGKDDGPDSNGDYELSASLRNRGIRNGGPLPLPEGYNSNTKGDVKVSITVDANGNVIPESVIVTMENTSTTDEELRKAAMEAAKKAKFNSSDGQDIGTIIYHFGIHI